MPYFLNKNLDGLLIARSNGDGYSINLKWATAYPNTRSNKIAYNIYMSSDVAPAFPTDFFNQSPAFVSVDGTTNVDIIDLMPGQMYHFAVRATEYDKLFFDLATLPLAFNGLVTLPQSLLRSNISATDTTIPLVDASQFPNSPGSTVKIGSELINYSSVDYVNNNLIVPAGTGGLDAHLVDQGGGHFYTPFPGNIGMGTINNLSIVGPDITETWTIKCVFVRRDGSNNPIPGTAKFEAIGSLSGVKTDPFGDDPIWGVYGQVVSNGILSFSITETSPAFVDGDAFTIEVSGPIPGVGNGRGFNDTVATIHDVDGYDGYVFWDPNVVFWPVESEEQNTRVFECWNRFDVGHYPFTLADGYRQTITDILTTNLTFSDTINTGFPAFDFAGFHRTDPVMILNGTCVGSYIGGYQFCADGYNGVGVQIRGISAQDANLQRQEVLLSTTGEPVCLMKRRWTGVTCDCMLPYNEYPESRCKHCYGTGFVVGWYQYFDPRRSDGKIMVRFDPTVDDLKSTGDGLESELIPNCWTLAVPTVKDRDFIVRFDEGGNEEFRYELLNVTRNVLFLGNTGAQQFTAQRVRKTDPIYQVKVFRDTSMFPMIINTSVNSSIGFPPHSHTLEISEKITSVSQINQLTGVSMGHNHAIENGVVLDEGLGHAHTITI